jgi:hypothetical protein
MFTPIPQLSCLETGRISFGLGGNSLLTATERNRNRLFDSPLGHAVPDIHPVLYGNCEMAALHASLTAH